MLGKWGRGWREIELWVMWGGERLLGMKVGATYPFPWKIFSSSSCGSLWLWEVRGDISFGCGSVNYIMD